MTGSKGGGSSERGPRARVRLCPICGKPSTGENYPFCSLRCADLDLHRWLAGVYVVPGSPEAAEQEGEEEA